MKQKLKNAGFKEEKREHWDDACDMFLDINREHKAKYTIAVNVSEKKYYVYRIATTIIVEPFEDLAHLSKLIFAFTRKDLDFEKKSYSWASCITKKGFYVDDLSCIHQQSCREYGSGQHRNVCRTESQARSILSTSQLFQIVAAINYDFEREEKACLVYPIISVEGDVSWVRSQNKMNPFGMNSVAACKELIRTNEPLLKQYFETE